MKWNPLDYQNIKSVHIPVEKLWKPDILLGKMSKKIETSFLSTYRKTLKIIFTNES